MISVVIPVYLNKKESVTMTERCIELAKHHSTIDIEWIIVETESDFFREHADLHLFEKTRTHCTKSINRGFKLATREYVVLLTNDVYLKSGWDEALIETFRKNPDCGMATLATSQLKHDKKDSIEEGVWCSIFMIPNKMLAEGDYLDERFVNSWDDSDLVMRTYERGFKMYRNYNVVVDHLIGATHYSDEAHRENFNRNKSMFKDKHRKYKDHRMYKILTEGWII